jgi:hypothetical protein
MKRINKRNIAELLSLNTPNLNLFGMVDAQIAVLEGDLLANMSDSKAADRICIHTCVCHSD